MKDYYVVLGVTNSATAEELRAAYKSKSKLLHPDVNQNKDTTKLFVELQEAYRVLSNPVCRRDYDLSRENEEEISTTKATSKPTPPEPEIHIPHVADLSREELGSISSLAIVWSGKFALHSTYIFTRINDLRRSHQLYVNSILYYIGVLFDIIHFFFFWLFGLDRRKALLRITVLGVALILAVPHTFYFPDVWQYYTKLFFLYGLLVFLSTRIAFLAYYSLKNVVSVLRRHPKK